MHEIDRKMMAKINALLRQLSEKAEILKEEDLRNILKQDMLLIGAFNGETLIGMVSIYFRQTMIRKVGTIEDVVVDKNYRRKGIGKNLTTLLIKAAREKGAECVELTSRPDERKEANTMYESMGFKKRDTNCYRLNL